MTKYFGTDGIRGEANYFFKDNLAYKVGNSLRVFNENLVVIGMDTRESSDDISKNITLGAIKAGKNVISLGVVPTPALSFISKKLQAIGVMVTASHNPYHDNGIKVFDKGEKLFLEKEKMIEDIIDKNEVVEYVNGEILKKDNILDLYLSLYEPIKTDLKIAFDTANGATSAFCHKIFYDKVKEGYYLFNEPNGKNINDNCGSTHIDNLRNFVLNNKLDLGVAYDGDGDRLLTIDELGNVISGDKLIYAFASYLKKNGMLNYNHVVLTTMSNLGIIKALKDLEIEVSLTDVGDKYVLEEITKNNYSLGGEASGHIINYDFLNTGDGLFNSYFLLKIITEEKKSLYELTKDLVEYPSEMVNIRIKKDYILEIDEVKNVISEAKKALSDVGKVIVRKSGTEPLVRVLVEAKDSTLVKKYIKIIVDKINEVNL